MDFNIKHSVIGETLCWMYSIEWQKIGLPHAHILVWLIKKITPDQFDQITSAEIPYNDIIQSYSTSLPKILFMVHVAHSTIIHHACLMGMYEPIPKELGF